MIDVKLTQHLTEKQKACFRALDDGAVNFVLYGGAAGGGKSYIGCLWLLYYSLSCPRTRWMMGRSVLKRLKETTLNTFFDICSDFGYTEYNYNAIA